MDDRVAERTSGSAQFFVAGSGRIHFAPHFEPGSHWITDDTIVDEEGRGIFGINSLYARIGDAVLVVDPSTWAPDATTIGSATLEPVADADTLLAAAGIDAGEVTHVVVTHGHVDHFNAFVRESGEPRFTNAVHLFPAADHDALSEEARAQLTPIEEAGALRLVSGDHAVCDGVRLVHAPGESPGHSVVRFDTGAERIYYLGDLVHFPVEFQEIDWMPVPNRDLAEVRQSRLRIFEEAEAPDALLLFTHGRFPAWGRIERIGENAWRWRYEQ
jgi:glyoxylase-like metal-dependent hydrolase (beta-lactamase superfamily II)